MNGSLPVNDQNETSTPHWVDSVDEATANWPEAFRAKAATMSSLADSPLSLPRLSPEVAGGSAVSNGEMIDVAASSDGLPDASDQRSKFLRRKQGMTAFAPTRPSFAGFEELTGTASPVLARTEPRVVEVPRPEVFSPVGDRFELLADSVAAMSPFGQAAPELSVPSFEVGAVVEVAEFSPPAIPVPSVFSAPVSPPAVDVPTLPAVASLADGEFPGVGFQSDAGLPSFAEGVRASHPSAIPSWASPGGSVSAVPSLEVPDFGTVDVPSVDVPTFDVPTFDVPAESSPSLEIPALGLPAMHVPTAEAPVLPAWSTSTAADPTPQPTTWSPVEVSAHTDVSSSEPANADLGDLRAMLSGAPDRFDTIARPADPAQFSDDAALAPEPRPSEWTATTASAESGWPATAAAAVTALPTFDADHLPSQYRREESSVLAADGNEPVQPLADVPTKGSRFSRVFSRDAAAVAGPTRTPAAEERQTRVMRTLAAGSLGLAALLLGFTLLNKPGKTPAPATVPVTAVTVPAVETTVPPVPTGAPADPVATEAPADRSPIDPAVVDPTEPADDFFSSGEDLTVK